MQESSKDMQDRNEFQSFHQSSVRSSAEETESGKMVHTYACAVCGFVLAKTEAPMDEMGQLNKLRAHRCQSPGKRDFEAEIT